MEVGRLQLDPWSACLFISDSSVSPKGTGDEYRYYYNLGFLCGLLIFSWVGSGIISLFTICDNQNIVKPKECSVKRNSCDSSVWCIYVWWTMLWLHFRACRPSRSPNTLLPWLPDRQSLSPSPLSPWPRSFSFTYYLKGSVARVSVLSFFDLYIICLFDLFYPSWLIYI